MAFNVSTLLQRFFGKNMSGSGHYQPKHYTLWEIPQIYHIFAWFDTTPKKRYIIERSPSGVAKQLLPETPKKGWPSGALPVASFRRSLACSSAAFWSSVEQEVASFPQMLVGRTCFVTTGTLHVEILFSWESCSNHSTMEFNQKRKATKNICIRSISTWENMICKKPLQS